MNASLTLDSRVLVIVGGTSGLGLSAACAVLRAGARVVVVGRNRETLALAVAELGEKATGYCGDAGDPGTAPAAIATAVERFGGFHGLYHVAGGSGRSAGDGPLHELTDEGLRYTMGLNLDALIYSNRAAVQAFLRQGHGGAILNMGSVLGFSPSAKYFSSHAYAAAKSAVVGFSQSVAAAYAEHGIRVNVIAPGLVVSPMSARAQNNQEIMHFIQTKQPLDGGRIGYPGDCDGAVVLLLSDAASFITGQVIAVDGGWSVSEGQISSEAQV